MSIMLRSISARETGGRDLRIYEGRNMLPRVVRTEETAVVAGT